MTTQEARARRHHLTQLLISRESKKHTGKEHAEIREEIDKLNSIIAQSHETT